MSELLTLALVLSLDVNCSVESASVSGSGRYGSCPTWLYLSEEGQCTCGSSLGIIMMCDNDTQEAKILWAFCLTFLRIQVNLLLVAVSMHKMVIAIIVCCM